MKKRIISFIMVIALALSMVPVMPLRVQAVSADEAAAYIPAVEKVRTSALACVSEKGVNNYVEGILFDLDNDGTDELVLSYPQTKDQHWVWYYTYSVYDVEQGKLVAKAENVSTGATAAVAGSGGFIGVALYNGEPVLITYAESGETSRGEGCKYPKWESTVKVYSYDDLRLIRTVEAQTTHEEILYAVDGKKISEEKFQKEMDRFTYLEFGIQNNIWIYFRNTVDRMPVDELLGQLKKLSPEKAGDTAKTVKRLAKIVQTSLEYDHTGEYTFAYNDRNLLESIHYESSSDYEYLQEFIYDGDGRFIRYGNSEENIYTYDGNGRLTKFVDRNGDMVNTHTYFYDSEGKLERSVDNGWNGMGEPETTKYFYDKQGRLERKQSNSGSEYYTYDSQGRLQKEQNDYATTTYTYAADGSLDHAYIERNHPTLEITGSLRYDFQNHAPFSVAFGENEDCMLWIEDTAGHTVWSLENTRSTAYTGELTFVTDADGLVISAEDEAWHWEFIYEILEEEIKEEEPKEEEPKEEEPKEEEREEDPTPRDTFSLEEDGWTFCNWRKSFAQEPVNHAGDYYIPRERYDEVFGSAYVDSLGLFTKKWNGSCAGMSATAILFFLDRLQWESIDEMYSGAYTNPNDFFGTVIYDPTQRGYYAAIGPDTEVTRLIEAYQLYINEIDVSKLMRNLIGTYYEADPELRTRYGVTDDKKPICTEEYVYHHIPANEGGTYIASMLEDFQEAYENNIPLWIGLQYNGAGHAIVSRTDLAPEDMGNGWWRVYVYDPNKPYINEHVRHLVSNEESNPTYPYCCNRVLDSGGDIFMELNPSLNQWRYSTSVTSDSTECYIGSTPSGDLVWKGMYTKDDNGKECLVMRPDFFVIMDLTDLGMEDFAHPRFDSTNAWIPENDLAVAVDGHTDCTIYSSTGELVAIVENGDAIVLSDTGSYSPYFGQSADGGSVGGRICLPADVYTVHYSSGNIHFLGNDNVISASCEGAAELTVDIARNSIQTVAQEDVVAAIKCANVISRDVCSYVDTEGALAAGETFAMAYSDEEKLEASTDSEEGKFRIYQKKAGREKVAAAKVVQAKTIQWQWIACAAAACLLAVLLLRSKAMRKLLLLALAIAVVAAIVMAVIPRMKKDDQPAAPETEEATEWTQEVTVPVAATEEPTEEATEEATEEETKADTLVGLTIRKTYSLGDTLDADRMGLLAVYESGKKVSVSADYTCSPETLTQSGSQTVTVSYGGITESFDIEVLDFFDCAVEWSNCEDEDTGVGYNYHDGRVNYRLMITARYYGNWVDGSGKTDVKVNGSFAYTDEENWENARNGNSACWMYETAKESMTDGHWRGYGFVLPDDPNFAGDYSVTFTFGDLVKKVEFTLVYNGDYETGTGWLITNVHWT